MKNNTSEIYRDIECQLLELFRECVISKDFSRLSNWLNDSVLFRRNRYTAECPMSKNELLAYLSDFFNDACTVDFKRINYIVESDAYALFLLINGKDYTIKIEVANNLVSTLWIIEKHNDLLPQSTLGILNAIAQAWEKQNWLYIENFLSSNFRFEMYGDKEIFGYHILSKRQFLVWLETWFKCLISHKIKLEIEVVVDGLKISIDNDARIISMKIVKGKILEAKEIDAPTNS